jgi:hypothetical protein
MTRIKVMPRSRTTPVTGEEAFSFRGGKDNILSYIKNDITFSKCILKKYYDLD